MHLPNGQTLPGAEARDGFREGSVASGPELARPIYS